jgi:hypothetical protein
VQDDKKPRDVGKLTVELGDYASAGKHGPFTLALDGDKKASKKSSKDSSRGSPSVKVLTHALSHCVCVRARALRGGAYACACRCSV